MESIALPKTILDKILLTIDHTNQNDPTHDEVDGLLLPKSLLYGQRMSHKLEELCSNPSDALKVAVRAQHIERWRIKRDDFEEGKKGYHQWRKKLYSHHATTTLVILKQFQCDDFFCETVCSLLRKERRTSNRDCQTLEDVACLVFLEYYLEEFAQKHSDEKLIHIIQKTWRKMSNKAQQKALKIKFMPKTLTIIQTALARLLKTIH